jgi:hypothetical protein
VVALKVGVVKEAPVPNCPVPFELEYQVTKLPELLAESAAV